MRELSSARVLDLTETGIGFLPPCIGNLKHLASLQLESTGICELAENIGDLKELQFLNVCGSVKLGCLWERISELKRLSVLDIRDCWRSSHLLHGITKLVSLERLKMPWSIPLDFEEDANVERKKGVMGNWSKI